MTKKDALKTIDLRISGIRNWLVKSRLSLDDRSSAAKHIGRAEGEISRLETARKDVEGWAD